MLYGKYAKCITETARLLSLNEEKVAEVLETFHALAEKQASPPTLFLTAIVDREKRYDTFVEIFPMWDEKNETKQEALDRIGCKEEELFFEGHVDALNKLVDKISKKLGKPYKFWYCDEEIGEIIISNLRIVKNAPSDEYKFYDELVNAVMNISTDESEHG